MYKWENAVITKKGMALMAKLMKGRSLYFIRAVAGAGYVDTDRLKYQVGVTDEKQGLSVGGQSYPEEGKYALTVRLYNTTVDVGYTATQIGIYAVDPDDGEILYMIAQAASGDGTDVPSKTDMPGYSAEWTFYIQYDQADVVIVTPDSEKPEIVPVTLSSSGWQGTEAPYTYTISGYDGKTVEVVEDVSMTMEQLEAIESAKIKSDPRSEENILYAFGDKPTIDVPVLLIVR